MTWPRETIRTSRTVKKERGRLSASWLVGLCLFVCGGFVSDVYAGIHPGALSISPSGTISCYEGDELTFTGSGPAHGYWYWSGSGEIVWWSGTGLWTGNTSRWRFPTAGTYTVTINDAGDSTYDPATPATCTIVVERRKIHPGALSITPTTKACLVGEEITFVGSGPAHGWWWWQGDGEMTYWNGSGYKTGNTTKWSFNAPGTYTVTVRDAGDDDYHPATPATATITVTGNRPPEAWVDGDVAISGVNTTTGRWTYAASDPDGNLRQWRLMLARLPGGFNDAKWTNLSMGPTSATVEYSFAIAGNYKLRFEAEDRAGLVTVDEHAFSVSLSATAPTGAFEWVNGQPAPASPTLSVGQSITASGWAADLFQGAPVAFVQLYIDKKHVGSAVLNGLRNDIAVSQQRPDWSASGWSFSYVIPPALAAGVHELEAQAFNHAGRGVVLGTRTFTVNAYAVSPVTLDSPGNLTILAGTNLVFASEVTVPTVNGQLSAHYFTVNGSSVPADEIGRRANGAYSKKERSQLFSQTGQYAIKAIAALQSGQVYESPTSTVTVVSNGAPAADSVYHLHDRVYGAGELATTSSGTSELWVGPGVGVNFAADVAFHSASRIRLRDGFRASQGSRFKAAINDTGAAAPPVIVSATAMTAIRGLSFTYVINATNSPISYEAIDLPPGLALVNGNVITGKPTTAGAFTVKLSATNAFGTGHRNLVVDVQNDSVNPEADSDGDGMLDWWEVRHNLDMNSPGDALADLDGDGLTNVAEHHLGKDPNNYDASTSELGNAVPAGWDALVESRAAKTSTVGATTGKLDVDKNGAAIYSIPLWVSPGTAGMQPQLALNYSSQAGPGIAGYGWSLSGVSVITRGPKTRAFDEAIRPVDFGSNDRFYLDGQRLVAVTGIDGADGTEYRTELESFSRIVSYGSFRNGPAYFKVWTKAGLLIEFGRAAGSRVDGEPRHNSGGQSPGALSWAVSKITDTAGNYLSFVYDWDDSAREQTLARIDYTGNESSSPVLTPYASVVFGYESRPEGSDVRRLFSLGSRSETARRLKTVTSRGPAGIAKTYTLNYTQQPIVGWSLLESITEADSAGRAYEPLSFTYTRQDETDTGWEELDAAFRPKLPLTNAGSPGTGYVDVNSDGRPDLVGHRQNSGGGVVYSEVWINEPGGYVLAPQWNLPSPISKDLEGDQGSRFVDLNGDGRIDYVKGHENNTNVYLNNGNGWTHAPAYTFPVFFVFDNGNPAGGMLLDVNADGLPDLVLSRANASQKGAYLNTGSGWSAFNTDWALNISDDSSLSTFFQDGGQDNGIRFVELNGDGLPDVLQHRANVHGVALANRAWLNTGTGWTPAPHFRSPNGKYLTRDDYPVWGVELIDINGDGLTDFLCHHANGTETHRETWLNNGDGWYRDPRFDAPYPLAINNNAGSGARIKAGAALIDLTRDGLPEMIWLRGGASFRGVSLGQPSGFASAEFTSLVPSGGFLSYDEHSGDSNRIVGAQFVDIDADGAPDLVWNIADDPVPSNVTRIGGKRNTTPVPNLLETVTNGFGVRAGIAYAQLTAREADGSYTVYDPASTIPGTAEPGAINTIAPMQVVKTVTNDDGVGGTHDINYRYGGLRSHRIRGSLGFETMSVEDDRTGIVSVTTFRQDYPFVGMPRKSITTAPGGASVTLSDTTTTYGQKIFPRANNGASVTTRFVFAKTVQAISRDLNGDIVSSSTTTTDRGVENAADYDDYGNSKYVSVDSGGGYVKTTVSTYDNITTDGKWHLGRLLSSTVTATGPTGDPDLPASLTRKSSFTYDPATGLLLTETVEPDDSSTVNPQRLVTTYAYDDFGNKETVTVSGTGLTDAAGDAADRVTETHYDARGRFPEWSRNALGHEEDYDYDQNFGVLKSLTGPNGLPTSWLYDGFGRKERETRSDGTTTTIAHRWSKTDAPGGAAYHIVTQSSGAPPSVVFHDRFGRAIYSFGLNGGKDSELKATIVGQRTDYDSLGRAYRSSLPFYYTGSIAGSTIATASEVTLYDALSRPITVWQADDEPARTHVITTYAYNGLTTSVTNGRNQRTDSIRNAQGQVVTVIANATAAAGADDRGEIRYAYDPLGNLCKTTVVKTPADTMVTKLTYDVRGRKTSMTDPSMGTWSYRYNAAGELVWQQDAKEQVSELRYDQLGRLVRRQELEGTTVWTYDTAPHPGAPSAAWPTWAGKLASVTAPSEIGAAYLETYTYDAQGRPKVVVRRIDGTDYSIHQAYDAYGRPTTVTYPYGYQVKNVYNTFGFLREVRQESSGTTLLNDTKANHLYWQADRYSIWGHVDGAQLGNGVTFDQTYSDVTGRVRAINHGLAGTSDIANYFYTYDAAGNVATRSDAAVGVGRNESYVYDGLNRLTSTVLTVAGGGLGISGTQSVTYDAYGNIRTKTGVGTYGYDPVRKTQVTSVTGGALQAATSYSYDANGNMEAGAGRTMAWTSFNQVKQIVGANGAVGLFSFGAGRERVIQQTQAVKTIYVGSLYEEMTRGGVTERKFYVFTPTGRTAVRTEIGASVETRYFHADMLGSVSAVTNESGRVVQRFAYDPWGRRTAQSSAVTGFTRGYTDHEHLEDLGLIHMNGRVYDPVLGRFLSADPFVDDAGDGQAYNRYSYVSNNPLNHTDPSGYFKLKDALKVVAVVVVAVVITIATYGAMTGQMGALMGYAFGSVGAASSVTASIGAVAAGGGWAAIGAVAAGGFASGFAGSLLNGGSVGDAFRAGVIGGAVGVLTAGIAGINYADLGEQLAWKMGAHGMVGGAAAELSGGSFRHGFMASAASAGLDYSGIGGSLPGNSTIATRTARAAVIGGTVSVIGGGKFANGATTSAFQHLFNNETQHKKAYVIRATKYEKQWNDPNLPHYRKLIDSLRDELLSSGVISSPDQLIYDVAYTESDALEFLSKAQADKGLFVMAAHGNESSASPSATMWGSKGDQATWRERWNILLANKAGVEPSYYFNVGNLKFAGCNSINGTQYPSQVVPSQIRPVLMDYFEKP